MKSLIRIIEQGHCRQILCDNCYFYDDVDKNSACIIQDMKYSNIGSYDDEINMIIIQKAKTILRQEKLKRILK